MAFGSRLTVAMLTHRARRFLDGMDSRLTVAALTHRARRSLDGVWQSFDSRDAYAPRTEVS